MFINLQESLIGRSEANIGTVLVKSIIYFDGFLPPDECCWPKTGGVIKENFTKM